MADMALSSAGSIANLASQIKDAVRTVRRNEEECRKIASYVEANTGILQRLVEGTEIAQDGAMRRALEDVEATFQDALRLVRKCQSRHVLRRLFSARGTAGELSLVLRDIGLKMQQASLCSSVQTSIVSTRIQCAVVSAITPPPYLLSQEEEDSDASPLSGFTQFSMSALTKATNNFSQENRIGDGGFSIVYKGVLHDGREVAVKKFRDPVRGDNMCLEEFFVGTKLQHKSVVSLLGYCIDVRVCFRECNGRLAEAEDRKNFLVLGHLPNGSLEHIIAGKRHIDWPSCIKIIREIAEAVQYIHEQRVIHLDLKASNILFDSDMTPVIIDFGLSKVLGPDDVEIVTGQVLGTPQFMPPEQFYGRASFKSDVFGFGITLLQTIISEDAISNHRFTCSDSGHWFCAEYWDGMLEEAGGLRGLVNPAVQVDESQLTEVNTCVVLGQLCTDSDPEARPSMADVLDILSGKKKLLIPTKPEKST